MERWIPFLRESFRTLGSWLYNKSQGQEHRNWYTEKGEKITFRVPFNTAVEDSHLGKKRTFNGSWPGYLRHMCICPWKLVFWALHAMMSHLSPCINRGKNSTGLNLFSLHKLPSFSFLSLVGELKLKKRKNSCRFKRPLDSLLLPRS